MKDCKTDINQIYKKLPYDGAFIGQDIQRFLGRHGGTITDGQLRNMLRRLTTDERACFAEDFGLVERLRPDSKITWDGDLQTNQTREARLARLERGCCPVHGVPMYQTGPWQYYDAAGNVVESSEGHFCPECPHCQARRANARHLCEAACLVCPIGGLADSPGSIVELYTGDRWLLHGEKE